MCWREWFQVKMIRFGLEAPMKRMKVLGVGQIALLSITPHGEEDNQATGVGMRTALR